MNRTKSPYTPAPYRLGLPRSGHSAYPRGGFVAYPRCTTRGLY
jgi:hypothetical protein